MRIKTIIYTTSAALMCISASHAATGNDYPGKPIRMVVPFAPGGPGDALGRLMGRKLTELLGHSVVVDNRSGASTIIGTEIVAKSPADGYTLLLISTTNAVNPGLFKNLPYDPVKDFAPLTMVASTPFMLVVHPSVQATSVQELVNLARTKPGSINYGSSGNGSSIHLTTELLKNAAKIEMTHVPYKGSGPAFIDVMGGQIQVLFSSTVSSLPHVKTGKVRGLALTSAKRAAALPNVPTIAESYPGFESSSWFGLLLPAKTPKPIMDRLLAESRAALKAPEINDSLTSQGAEPGGNSPTEFKAYFESEIKKWAGVIKAAGVKMEQ
jgi:tripartite-type tricarboxylate transporter receptor subunit TctC